MKALMFQKQIFEVIFIIDLKILLLILSNLLISQLCSVDPKLMARHFSSKIGLFGNNKELQLGTCDLMANHAQVQRNEGEKHSFRMWEGLSLT